MPVQCVSAPFSYVWRWSPAEGTFSSDNIANMFDSIFYLADRYWSSLEDVLDVTEALVGWELDCEDKKPPTPQEFASFLGVEGGEEGSLVADLYDTEILDMVRLGRLPIPEDFVLDLTPALELMYSVLSPPKPGKYGQLGKLGIWLNRRMVAWCEGNYGTWDLLNDIFGSIIRSDIGTLRQVIFVAPFIKKWLAEGVAMYVCVRGRESLLTSFKVIADFIVRVDMPLLWLKLRTIDMVSTHYGVDPNRNACANCVMLSALKPLTKMTEAVNECLKGLIEGEDRNGVHYNGLCDDFADLFTPAWRGTARKRCLQFLDNLVSDPLVMAVFWHMYTNAPSSHYLTLAYNYLAESFPNIHRDWITRVIRFLRREGQFPYPKYMGVG